MDERFIRNEMLLGIESTGILRNKKVAIFGIGGVGGYVAESIARSGIGHILLVDSDTVSLSNINRQIYALTSTVGKLKTEVAKNRILDINPSCDVKIISEFYCEDSASCFEISGYDYIVDAIDTVSSKILLIKSAQNLNIPIISSMGAGNKLDPCAFKVSDIYKTSGDPLAKAIRTIARKENIKPFKVVYSPEVPKNIDCLDENGKRIPASNSFVPPVVGLIIASEVIKDLLK